MSFSSDVKNELYHLIPKSLHCRMAELSGIIAINGRIENNVLIIRTENELLESKIRKLSNLVISADSDYLKPEHEKLHHRKLICTDPDIQETYFTKLKLSINDNRISVGDIITERSCCKQAYLRGAFLAGGSVGSPDKTYQMSIICSQKEEAEKLQRIVSSLHISLKVQKRNNRYAVYIKDGDTISEFMALVGAVNSLMDFENIRILKDIRNNVNREVNCDTANMAKTVSAATNQLDDIKYIKEHGLFDELPEALRIVANARLNSPLLSIKELGEDMSPRLSKSCINHRLRKISEIADNLRKEEK